MLKTKKITYILVGLMVLLGLSLFTLFSQVISPAPTITSVSAETYDLNGLSYTYVSSTTSYTVTGCNQSDLTVEIPSTYNDGINGSHPVDSIGTTAFYNGERITSIKIPASINSIITNGSWYLDSLRNIYVDIGNTKFATHNNVSLLGKNDDNTTYKLILFCQGNSLTNYTIPNNVTIIEDYAFFGCDNLTSITIPNGVTSIGSNSFGSCYYLNSITIPSSVTSIESGAFLGCNLTNIYVSGGSNFKIYNGALLTYDGTQLIFFPQKKTLTSYTIPSTVTSISSFAFYGCSNLNSVTISSSVTYIGGYAFNSSNISSFSIPDTLCDINYYAFDNTPWYTSQANGMVYTGKVAYSYKGTMTSNTSITLKSDTIGIAGYAFRNKTNLIEITLPSTLVKLGYGAFNGCSNLYTLVCNATTPPTISSNTFTGTKIATDPTSRIFVPSDSLAAYKSAANWNTYADQIYPLDYSILPWGEFTYSEISGSGTNNVDIRINSVTSSLKSYTIDSIYANGGITYRVKEIGSGSTDTSIDADVQNIVLINGITKINDYAFYNCSSLNSISMPNSLTSIGYAAFYNCYKSNPASGLTTITIPNSVYAIGQFAFAYCTSLSSVTLPTNSNFKTISDSLFYQCDSLTSITIPNNVTTIEYQAFYGSGLASITIPYSVTSIGASAFKYCTS